MKTVIHRPLLLLIVVVLVVFVIGCATKKAAPETNTNTPVQPSNTQTQVEAIQTTGTSFDKFSINLKFKTGTDVCGTKTLLPDSLMNSVLRINTICAQGLQASLREKSGPSFDPSLWVAVQLKADANPETTLAAMKQAPGVESAEFNSVPQL